MQHQPGSWITDADLFGQLHRRDALLVVAHAVNRPEPTAQRSPRLVKDGPRRHRALVSTQPTLMHLARCHVPATRPSTARTRESPRPALPVQLFAALLFVAKPCPELTHRHHSTAP